MSGGDPVTGQAAAVATHRWPGPATRRWSALVLGGFLLAALAAAVPLSRLAGRRHRAGAG